jgi:phenylacetate-coenzyme A ligase PaaK-like adenylate-forming protein
MLRYLLGDLVALSREPCPHCGRLGERVVATPRRTGNLVKCRGMLVNTDVILDVVSAQEGAGEFQVVFQRGDAPGAMDELVIRIERETGEGAAAEALRDTLVQRVRAAVSLRSTIEFVARGTLYDERNIKAKRVIDTRKIAD